MNRWTLLAAACLLQPLGIFLMYKGKHFAVRRPTQNEAWPAYRYAGYTLFIAGIIALTIFGIWEQHLLLLAGQGIFVLLCMAGSPRLFTSAHSRRQERDDI